MKKVSRHPLLFGTTLLSLAAATLYGCKDFLEDASAPQGSLNQESLANRAGVEGALVAAYRVLDCTTSTNQNWGCAASNWVWGSVTSDDAYKGSEASDQPPINDIEAYVWSTAAVESYLNVKWRAVYEGVVRSNATLRLMQQVQAESPGEIPTADAQSIEGEAIFLRAHYHFEAWRMWGNVPYYREADTDFRKANLTSAEVVTNIIQDLDAAIALLPVTPRNKGRVSQWTAKAYKGRVQIHNGQFADGRTTLQEVRTSGVYDLETSFDRVWTGFSAFANGKETILAYQASSNDGEPNGDNANWGERLNFPHSGSPFGCCGFHQPSQNLVNFFAVDALGLPLSVSDPNNWNANDANFTAGNMKRVDPRLDWTVGRDNVPYKDWGVHEPDWIRSVTYGGPYSPKKNAHESASGAQQTSGGWAPQQQNSVNIHLFRYADLLLLIAEAEVELGNPDAARLIVNQIRTRAAQTAQGPGTGGAPMAVPINDASITWADYHIGNYVVPWTNADVAREAVRNERRLELAMEGQRFFDLRRWGIAEAVINAHNTGVGGGAEPDRLPHLGESLALTSRHRYYPIPAIQIELSKVGSEVRLQQNPGW